MNPDPRNDWLDRALKSREAMTPPPGFTAVVLRRIAAARQPGAISAFLAEEGVRLGVTIAAVGFLSLLDMDQVGNVLNQTVQAHEAVGIAAVTLGLTWFVMSRRADEA